MRRNSKTRQALLSRLTSLWILAVSAAVGAASIASFAASFPSMEEFEGRTQPSAASSASWRVLSDNSMEEIWKKSQSLRPEPSTDTTPVAVKIGEVSYGIPRNYISNLHLGFPVLKVTYPGFKPLTEETSGCFDRKLQVKLGCTTLELNLRLSLPNRPRFENLLKLVSPDQKVSPRRGADDYQVYDLGPENAREEIYRSESEDIFFTCGIFDNNGVRDAVCDDAVSLADGNAVRFFFRLNQVGQLRKFEAGIRQLMSQFKIGANK